MDEEQLQPELDSEEVVIKDEPLDLRAELKQNLEAVKKDRARDETGKFAKAPKEEVKQKENEPVEVVTPPAALKAPAAWGAEAKAKFAELPEWAQKEALRREEEVHKGFTKFDEERQFGKQIKDVISPYMAIIQAEGGTPLTAVKDLLNTAYILRTAPPHQKEQLFHTLARQYGVNLGQSPSVQNIDPTVQALQQQVQQLTGYINQTVSTQQQQEQASIQSQIDAFAADPKNIHFEDVRNDMGVLLGNGMAKDLQEAYDKAVWARPDIRSTLLASQQQDSEAKRIADAKAKAEAARKAGGSINGRPGMTAPPNNPDRSLREELFANLRASSN